MTKPSRLTDASLAVDRLRSEIVSGALPPGAKLKLVPLAERYRMSRGPLREAASRLAAEELVVIEDQRGFRVAEISREDLEDVTQTRQRLESLALRDAIAHGDLAWEGDVLAAWHVLERVSELDESPEGRREFSTRHALFHATLCRACPSKHLRRFREMLYTHTERYRRLAADRYRARAATRDVAGEHAAIVRAVIDRDADRACALLEDHFRRTADTLIDGYPEFFGGA